MPDGNQQAPFRKALIGLNGGPTDEHVVHLACQLAKPGAAELIAVHVVEVDWSHELSAELAGQDEQTSAILDGADAIAERYKVTIQTSLLQARDVGAALVDEAVELGVDAIILGLPFRKRFGGDFALGTALPSGTQPDQRAQGRRSHDGGDQQPRAAHRARARGRAARPAKRHAADAAA
jgi:nucleotide-binding universal stress UspA family protein